MKIINALQLLFLLFSISFLSSCGCTPTVYAPTSTRHLLIKEKNDLRIAGHLNGVQFGYSPIKYLGLQGSYFRKIGKQLSSEMTMDNFCSREKTFIDIAIGGYYLFSPKRIQNEYILLSTYLGYGQGTARNEYYDNSEYLFYHHTFSQQLGIQYFAKQIQIGYFFKREVNDLYEGSLHGKDTSPHILDFNSIVDTDLDTYYFSTIKANLELKSFWLFCTITWNHDMSTTSFYPKESIQAGVTFDLNDLYQKITKKK